MQNVYETLRNTLVIDIYRSKIERSIVLTMYQHTYVKLGNLGNNKTDDSYTAEHIKNWSFFIVYIFTILKINLLKENVIKYGDYDNK